MNLSSSLTLIFIAGTLILSGTVRGDEANRPCPPSLSDDSFASLQQLSNSLPAILTPTQLEDISNFCRVNGLRDFNKLFEEDEKFRKSAKLDGSIQYNPWMGSFIAASDRREMIWKAIRSGEAGAGYQVNVKAETIQNATPLAQSEISRCKKEIKKWKEDSVDQENDTNASLPQAAFFCKDVTYRHVLDCANSLQDILKLAKPHHEINLLDIWQEVLENPVYLRVMKKVALQNIDLIDNGRTPKSRFFDDLNEAFLSELHDKDKATDFTFNLLGALASNGNNTYGFIPCDVSREFRSTVLALSLGSIVLDRRAATNGFLYTYPKEVNSLCDYGKNYHFWMAAFLARYEAKKTGNIQASAAAAFTVNKGYQFLKQDGGRDPANAFKENVYSNYNNNMRLDLAQAAAGAWYGASSIRGSIKSLSRAEFETGMKKIFEGSKLLPQDPKFSFPSKSNPFKLVKTYSTWKQIINPDAAYSYFEELYKK